MESCNRGDAPEGSGVSCINCGNGRYSDGGPGADQCVTCPPKGVVCSGGILQLLPGFFRADSSPVIDESTELHPCWYPNGCWVDTETNNRSAVMTHHCNTGYSGALARECWPSL